MQDKLLLQASGLLACSLAAWATQAALFSFTYSWWQDRYSGQENLLKMSVQNALQK